MVLMPSIMALVPDCTVARSLYHECCSPPPLPCLCVGHPVMAGEGAVHAGVGAGPAEPGPGHLHGGGSALPRRARHQGRVRQAYRASQPASCLWHPHHSRLGGGEGEASAADNPQLLPTYSRPGDNNSQQQQSQQQQRHKRDASKSASPMAQTAQQQLDPHHVAMQWQDWMAALRVGPQ